MASSTKKRTSGAATQPGWFGLWDRLTPTARHLLCVLALLVVSVGFFAPIHFSGQRLIGGDTVQWRSMAESVLAEAEATGETPLWATNAFAGMPAFLVSYAPQVPQVDDVFRLLRKVVWPTSHFIALLVGMYLLVFFLTRQHWTGVLAACAYGLTTYLPVILTAGHNSKFIALCYAPWLVLTFAYALRRPRLLAGLLFAVALAANLRAGHVQITYYVTFTLGIWWLVELIGAVRHGRAKAFAQSTGVLALGSVLALAMVAQPYLVTAEYKAFTIRGAASGGAGGDGGLAWDYAMAWSQGFGELVTLLIAGAYGEGGGTYWGPKLFTEGPHYVGGIVVLLALLGLWRVRRNAVYGFGIAAFLMILFALGENLAGLNRFMFDFFPLFDAFRVPETWLSIVALALAVLAGFGLHYATRPAGSATRRKAEPDTQGDDPSSRTRSVYVTAGVVAGLVLVLYLGKDAFFDFEKPNEEAMLVQQVAAQNNVSPDDPRVVQTVQSYLAEQRDLRRERFNADALRTLFFVLVGGALLAAHRREKLPGWAVQAALALLVVVDLWGVGRRHLNEERLVPAEDAEDQIATYDFDQFILQQQQQAGGPGLFRVLSLESGNPMTNARPAYHYETLGGYHGAKLRIYQDYIEQIYTQPGTRAPNDNALDLLNTRYIVAPGQLPGTEVVFQSQTGLNVLENPDAVPRAFFVGETEVIEDVEALWRRIQDPAFEPRQTALLQAPLEGFTPTPIDSASTTSVELEAYSADEIAWQVETDAPRLLVVSEVFYPAGWQATVDGEPVPIVQADYLLRAVPVPAGQHQVVMRFDPPRHRLGVWVTAASTLLVYGGVLVLLGLAWTRRREDDEGPEEQHP